MSQLPDLIISATEAQMLSNLVREVGPHHSPLSRMLQPFLDITRIKWMRDFLFTPSDIHIPYLLSPSLPTTAITCFMKSTSIDVHASIPLKSSLPGESHYVAGNVLFAPVFTADCITLGVGAIDGEVAMAYPWIPYTGKDKKLKLNLRFARDGAAGILLLVYEAPQDD